jgi:hypothetical protein
MPVVKCPQCQTKLRPPVDRTTFKCPRCSKVLRVPGKEPPSSAPVSPGHEAPPPTAPETSSEIPVASETQAELPVLAGVDPEQHLPPLVEEEPERPAPRKVTPQVHVPTLGVKGFDLAGPPPAPPPRRKWKIAVGRLQIHPVRLAVALAIGLVVLGGVIAAQIVVESIFGVR